MTFSYDEEDDDDVWPHGDKRITITPDEQLFDLGDGTYILLIERNVELKETKMTPEDYSRNVYRMRDDGSEMWRISTEKDHKGAPFTHLFIEKNPCAVDRWDGCSYLIDMETGRAKAYSYHR